MTSRRTAARWRLAYQHLFDSRQLPRHATYSPGRDREIRGISGHTRGDGAKDGMGAVVTVAAAQPDPGIRRFHDGSWLLDGLEQEVHQRGATGNVASAGDYLIPYSHVGLVIPKAQV